MRVAVLSCHDIGLPQLLHLSPISALCASQYNLSRDGIMSSCLSEESTTWFAWINKYYHIGCKENSDKFRFVLPLSGTLSPKHARTSLVSPRLPKLKDIWHPNMYTYSSEQVQPPSHTPLFSKHVKASGLNDIEALLLFVTMLIWIKGNCCINSINTDLYTCRHTPTW